MYLQHALARSGVATERMVLLDPVRLAQEQGAITQEWALRRILTDFEYALPHEHTALTLEAAVEVAHASATIDLLSGGRFELGIGAGYGRSAYAAAGLAYRPAAVRVDRLAESVELIRHVWRGSPATFDGLHYSLAGQECAYAPVPGGIPILVGGDGERMLRVAAQMADAIGFIGVSQSEVTSRLDPSHVSRSGLSSQVALVREAPGDRFPDLELSILVQQVTLTNDRCGAASGVASWLPADVSEILDSPFVLLGSWAAICEQIHQLREALRIAYITVLRSSLTAMTEIVAAM